MFSKKRVLRRILIEYIPILTGVDDLEPPRRAKDGLNGYQWWVMYPKMDFCFELCMSSHGLIKSGVDFLESDRHGEG